MSESAHYRDFTFTAKVRRGNTGQLFVWVASLNKWLPFPEFKSHLFVQGLEVQSMLSPVEANLSPKEFTS